MINELDKVDFMGLDKVDQSKLILVITDHLDWQFVRGHLLLLQEKLNNYINYILNGDYKDTYRDNIHRFQIMIYVQYQPHKKLEKLLLKFRKELAKQVPDVPIEIDYQFVPDEDE